MAMKPIKYCPGTLAEGFDTYSRTCLNRLFNGKSVNPILPYDSPSFDTDPNDVFDANRKLMSISGVQEKFSMLLVKNKLRLVQAGERGTYILKPIPAAGKRRDQMPANEHLTMQLARQVYGIETAENALIFFKDGAVAYITKRFDVRPDGSKWAQDDFASLDERTPQSHGDQYKYLGNYYELFQLMQTHLPAYKLEAPKLLRVLLFNYLFSNGDAHFKNFSLIETPMGDYRLSPAYDLLNSRIHIDDNDFALDDGLLPRHLAQGRISVQFSLLAKMAGINENIYNNTFNLMVSKSEYVKKMIEASYLNDATKRNYWQAYSGRLRQLVK
jgi:serine/threonine-protein kinase HipA